MSLISVKNTLLSTSNLFDIIIRIAVYFHSGSDTLVRVIFVIWMEFTLCLNVLDFGLVFNLIASKIGTFGLKEPHIIHVE